MWQIIKSFRKIHQNSSHITIIDDIFYFIEHGTLYNYADDNTLSYADQDYNTLINVLEKETSILIEWFNFNCMQTIPDKFYDSEFLSYNLMLHFGNKFRASRDKKNIF
jgi:hypothetical protein